MNAELDLAFAIAKALIAGRTLTELNRLQIILQAISSMLSAEIGCQRLTGTSTAQSQGGASQ